ncbi:MAG: glutamine--fructose-6-phosphate transaminase (isomerizing) [Nitrospira sp.]|nr:glutamine--fructose-6-phosphate transaminase (isomerizing) [bacterium]MBL7048213.1 glutamine--fructose-6-phosphate transaminase (isomerizing) [Nitrospira sp.]
MCGIVGYIGPKNVIPILINGLKKLEYRGYDSAGICFLNDGQIGIRRCAGKIKALETSIKKDRLKSLIGIGHTRWATHGKPTEENAHPHRAGGIVVVHNGIIENYIELKEALKKKGHKFTSETDTEVICHLIYSYTKKGDNLELATKKALKHVDGAYAIGVISEAEPDKIIAVKNDSPLCIGIGKGEYFIASDIPAFLKYTRDAIILENGDMATLTREGCSITNIISNKPVRIKPTTITWSPAMAEKGGYKHFMLKEIYEQPRAVADTIRGRFSVEKADVNLKEFSLDKAALKGLNKIFLVACGTSWHAALVGKYMIEDMARIPCEVDIASEFRYRRPLVPKGSLMIVITQSGETADTLAAQKEAKRLGAKTLTICNVVGSTSSRDADSIFYTHSGPEIGVASTKAFTTQLSALYIFSIAVARARGGMKPAKARELFEDLLQLPEKIESALHCDKEIQKIARKFHKVNDFLYLGRGINYPIALEGALKLKEISYIHAEGYPAGEMKHGPIALIDSNMPVVALAHDDHVLEKILSNMEEVKSRGGKVIAIATEGNTKIKARAPHIVYLPKTNYYLTPIIFSIPLHLLAYHISVLRKCNVDQPRNLAKSVTVE